MGVLIYIYFREVNPKSINTILIFFNINQSPKYYSGIDNYVPNWFIYNLPDALWAYSMTFFVVIIERKESLKIKLFYSIISYAIIIGQEALQGSLLQGTYDFNDIVAVNLGFFFGLYTSSTLGARYHDS